MMDHLAGVKAAMGLLADEGQAPTLAGEHGAHRGVVLSSEAKSLASVSSDLPVNGGAPSGAAGSALSGGGSTALYALLIALAGFAGGLWGRLQEVPVRWRSVTIVALNERPG